jgi:hypothetical protein
MAIIGVMSTRCTTMIGYNLPFPGDMRAMKMKPPAIDRL